MRFRGLIIGCLAWGASAGISAGHEAFFDHPYCDVKTLSAFAQMVLPHVKPGVKRSFVEKFFHFDGGGQTETYTRYCFSLDEKAADYKVVKIDILFHPAGMDDATFNDPQRCRDWLMAHSKKDGSLGSPDDTVIAVSKPYREQMDAD